MCINNIKKKRNTDQQVYGKLIALENRKEQHVQKIIISTFPIMSPGPKPKSRINKSLIIYF